MILVWVACLLVPRPMWAQEQSQARDVDPSLPEAVDNFAYDPGGRRDPFVSLVRRGRALPARVERPDGLLGLSVNDVALRGVVANGDEYLALIESPDNQNFIVRAQERLYDGWVSEISRDEIVLVQEVQDPVSFAVVEREIRKGFRNSEESR